MRMRQIPISTPPHLGRHRYGHLAGNMLQQQHSSQCKRARRRHHGVLTKAGATQDALVPLGLDFLTFLAATVLVIPVFKSVKASPILGFLFSGLLLGQLG